MTIDSNGRKPIDPVLPEDVCLKCDERECDRLVWIDDDRVECQRCRTIYRPGETDATTE